MQATTSPRWDRPVFVVSMGRSGSTLLQRVLNVHPHLTIWGEHGGFLKGLLDSYAVTQHDANRGNLIDGYEHRASVIGERVEDDTFKPWVSPFRPDDLVESLRQLMLDLFTRELTPEIRWGFKEIRYSMSEIMLLMELFPKAHLIVLARDMEGQVMSRFFKFGNTNFDLLTSDGLADAEKKLTKMVNAWIRRNSGMLDAATAYPDRASIVSFGDLAPGSSRPQTLFAELGESPASDQAIDEVLGSKTGSSYGSNSQARSNRERLAGIIAGLEYDRVRHGELAAALGIS